MSACVSGHALSLTSARPCRLTVAAGGAPFDVPPALCSCLAVAVARGPRWLCGRPVAAAGRRAMSLSQAKCQTAASTASYSGDIAASTFLSLLRKLQSAQTTSGSVSLPAWRQRLNFDIQHPVSRAVND